MPSYLLRTQVLLIKAKQEADVSRLKATFGREGDWGEFGPQIKVIMSQQLRRRLLSLAEQRSGSSPFSVFICTFGPLQLWTNGGKYVKTGVKRRLRAAGHGH